MSLTFFKVANLFLLIILFFSCKNKVEYNQHAIPETFKAEVIGIKDGDTVEVLYKDSAIIIRLANIDCPERKQAFGKKAKQFLSKKIYNTQVEIVSDGERDRWNRLVAEIFSAENENINKLMLKEGLAMHYKSYSNDYSYEILEKEAMLNKKGIWSQKETIPPWIFRKKQREEK